MRRLKGRIQRSAVRVPTSHRASPGLESIEERVLLSSFVFDPDGGGPDQAMTIDALDWSPANGLLLNGGNLTVGKSVDVLIQQALGGVIDPNGNETKPVGLGTNFEITSVARVSLIVTSISPDNSLITFSLDPVQGPNTFFEIWFDPAANSDPLAGTGFNDGTRILLGKPTPSTGGTANVSILLDQTGHPFQTAFDKFGVNNYPGIMSVIAPGALVFDCNMTMFDSTFFQSPLTDLSYNSSLIAPFNETNPSAQFVGTPGGAAPNVMPNIGTVNGSNGADFQVQVDGSSSFETGTSAIAIAKQTNGQTAPTPPGPLVAAGSTVTFTYQVTNPGTVPLHNVTVTDDNGTPNNPADDFRPTFTGGDTNGNGVLDPGETWTYAASAIAQVGQYENRALVTGISLFGPLQAQALSHYLGVFTFTVLNTNDSGRGSLRQAILNSNAHPGIDTIDFKIPGAGAHIIRPITPLPPVIDPAIIDAYTQPGARANSLALGDDALILVGIDGSAVRDRNANGVLQDASGLIIGAGQTTVRGLAIGGFLNVGIELEQRGGNAIRGNFLGTDTTGSQGRANLGGGLFVAGTAGNTVGGLAPADRNLISANDRVGLELLGAGATGNQILGNYVGTDATGTRALGNANTGVLLFDAPRNTVGGTAPGAGNLISGNLSTLPPTPTTIPPEQTGAGGVVLFGAQAVGNVVQGNFIGTDRSGNLPIGNAFDGVDLSNAGANLIGGTDPGARNVISANGFVGIRVVGPLASGNQIQGNLVGTDKNGRSALGNKFDGIFVDNAPANMVGGSGAGNLVSGNRGSGVQLRGPGATGNLVQGNLIGTDLNGTGRLGNRFDGILLNQVSANTLGGTTAGAGNLIVANGFSGIDILGPGATADVVQGNAIIANVAFGVLIQNASGNTVGGVTPGAGNFIVQNAFGGIQVMFGNRPLFGPNPGGNLIAGNLVAGNGRGPFRLQNQQSTLQVLKGRSAPKQSTVNPAIHPRGRLALGLKSAAQRRSVR